MVGVENDLDLAASRGLKASATSTHLAWLCCSHQCMLYETSLPAASTLLAASPNYLLRSIQAHSQVMGES